MEDRDLVTRVVQSMSNQIAGRSGATATLPGEDFLPSTIAQPSSNLDEPDAPGAHTADDGHDHGAPPAPKGKANSAYAWGNHQNGRIPADQLTTIGGGHRLERTAAQAWQAMVADAAKAGIKVSLTDSYRSYDAQVSVRKRKGDKVATATPGTSVHGWGRAVDANVKDPKVLQWLHTNGPKYGWVNPAWAKKGGKNFEPWHLEYVGGK